MFSIELVYLLPIDKEIHFYPFKTPSDSRKSFLLFECKTVNVKPVGKKSNMRKGFFIVMFICIF